VIRVVPAPEPASFDAQVRQPGLSAIAELVGEKPLLRRRGRARKKVAEKREDIPGDKFPEYWRLVLDDLLEAYGRICAYVCVYIERITGQPSVDHMAPKSLAWDQVYEWKNYRLACSLMNSRKGAIIAVLDPFEVEDGWFELELVSFQIVAGEGLDAVLKSQVDETIDLLKLNDAECRRLREEYVVSYLSGEISWSYLRKRSPFVARELQREGRLRKGDS
jgi:hypothetical protein